MLSQQIVRHRRRSALGKPIVGLLRTRAVRVAYDRHLPLLQPRHLPDEGVDGLPGGSVEGRLARRERRPVHHELAVGRLPQARLAGGELLYLDEDAIHLRVNAPELLFNRHHPVPHLRHLRLH